MHRTCGTTGTDGVEVCDDKGAQFQEVEKAEEYMRIGAANFHRRHILAGQLWRVGLSFLQLFNDHGQQQSLARSFD